ncbi:hypothetical protein GGS20DRAFT_512987 [Poronia punctata]|nr:hypothetical protein GGS20DRAFT_512987 [Poronia punctata]
MAPFDLANALGILFHWFSALQKSRTIIPLEIVHHFPTILDSRAGLMAYYTDKSVSVRRSEFDVGDRVKYPIYSDYHSCLRES